MSRPDGCLSSDIIILFTETGTSTGQGIPGILLSLPPQCWDSKGVHNTRLFHTGPGDSTHSQLNTLPTELSPQPAWKPLRSIQCVR